MSKVPRYIAIKYMCEILYRRSKKCNVKGVEDGVCSFYATLYAEYRFHVGDIGEMHAALLHACRIFIVAVVGDIGEGSNHIVYHNPNYSY